MTLLLLLHSRVAAGSTVLIVRGAGHLLSMLPVQPMQRLKTPWKIPDECSSNSVEAEVPVSSQLARFTPISGQQGGDYQLNREIAWGIPFKPPEFVSMACKKGHFRTSSSQSP